MNSEKLLEAFSLVEDEYLEKAEQKQKKRPSLKKKALILIAAVLCISLLSVTAIARLPSVFAYLRQMDPEDAPLYEAAQEANRDSLPEPVELPQMKEASLIVHEKYYNGETVLLGLDVKAVEGAPAIGFEPDVDLMKQIRAFGYTAANPDVLEGKPYPRYAGDMADALRHELTEEEYAQMERSMETTGHCCIVFSNAFVGDHIHVNGTDMMATYDMDLNSYAGITEGSTPAGEAIRLDPLPENAKNQEKVTVTLKISYSFEYWYLDQQGHGYILYDHQKSVPADITIPRSETIKEAE